MMERLKPSILIALKLIRGDHVEIDKDALWEGNCDAEMRNALFDRLTMGASKQSVQWHWSCTQPT